MSPYIFTQTPPMTVTASSNVNFVLTDSTWPIYYEWWQPSPALAPGARARVALAGIARPLLDTVPEPVLAVRARYTVAPRTSSHERRRRRRWRTRRL